MTTLHIIGCTGKIRFQSFFIARTSARKLNQRSKGAHVEAYHCTHCNGFHVGENRDYRRKDKRRDSHG